MNKITKATFKSFIRKNEGKLFIKQQSHFDGMTDCIQQLDGGYVPVQKPEYNHEETLGIQGVWLVGGGRDYFTAVEENGFKGICCYNCCGQFILAVKV